MLWFILGVLTWQAVSVIVWVASKEDEDLTALVGGGFVLITTWFIVTRIKKFARRGLKRK